MFSFANFSPIKNLAKTVFSFRWNLPFLIFSILFHYEKHCCEQIPLKLFFFLFDLSYEKNSSVFWKWISLVFFFVFLYSRFLILFFVTFCFCSSRFAFTFFFSFPFMFDLFLFLISSFFEQQFHLLYQKKNSSTYPFFMHALPLCVPLLIHLFICCLCFLSSFFSRF